MNAEIIAVGTELLMGQVVNTNAAFISEQLQDLGIDVYFHTTVGDNAHRMQEALEIARKRSDVLIITGGLGPTEDDMTKQVVAKFLGEELIPHAPSVQKLLDYFEKSGRVHTANNDLQALIMEGAIPLTNETGFAIGAFIEKAGKIYAVLPGPPNELKPMFVHYLKPILLAKSGERKKIFSKVMRFYGIGESQLVTKLAPLIETQEEVTIAPYAKVGEVTLRLAVKSTEEKHAQVLLNQVEERILQTEDVGEFFYGYGDGNSLAHVVVDLLRQKGKRVSAAESLTGGLFQATLCDISGASEVFSGGFVTYSLLQKALMLGIEEEKLREHGVVSTFCAKEMAEKARMKTDADYALSFTGVAGPEKLEGKEVGTVIIALASRNEATQVETFFQTRGRSVIRHNSVLKGLDMLRRALM